MKTLIERLTILTMGDLVPLENSSAVFLRVVKFNLSGLTFVMVLRKTAKGYTVHNCPLFIDSPELLAAVHLVEKALCATVTVPGSKIKLCGTCQENIKPIAADTCLHCQNRYNFYNAIYDPTKEL